MARMILGTFNFLTLLYFSIVQDIRQSDGNALRGILKEVMQSLIMVGVFYFMINILGLRTAAVRGNFVLYLMTGIFLFMTHIKAIGKISGSGNATNPMLKHAPVSTLLLILSAALSTLYIQLVAMGTILFIGHVLIEPIEFYDFKGFIYCFIAAWTSGVAIGIVFLALKPFAPTTIQLITTIYQRANMVFSGKCFWQVRCQILFYPTFYGTPCFTQ